MGLGDSLNNLAGGYARGQAQYKENEKVRKQKADDAMDAAYKAADFRLKLATHSQALTNSAEAEYSKITAAITNENWDPALLSAILPQAANFDKTYGAVWKGGSATEMVQRALHLEPTTKAAAMEPGKQGPPTPNIYDPLMGFATQGQKDAADEKARKSRTAEAARSFTVQAAEYARTQDGGMPDEATFYKRVYDFQDKVQREVDVNGRPAYDLETLDTAMDIIRENAAGYYKGLADNLALATGNQNLSDKIRERGEQVGKDISAWTKSVLLMDADGNPISGDLFATRSPLQLEMERIAQPLAAQGMSTNQIKANLIFRFRDELGGLNLDIKAAPYDGSLTLMGADPEFQRVSNRFFDTNESPDEDQLAPMWNDDPNPEVHGGWIVNLVTGEGKRIYVPIQTPETPSVLVNPNAGFMPGGGSARTVTTPKVPSQSGRRASEKYEKIVGGPAKEVGKAFRAVPAALKDMLPPHLGGTK